MIPKYTSSRRYSDVEKVVIGVMGEERYKKYNSWGEDDEDE
jgi:hypothetical protein